MNRLIGVTILLLWAGAVYGLLERDVIPYWRAETRPEVVAEQSDRQLGIYLGERRIGTGWVSSRHANNVAAIRSTTMLESAAFPIPILQAHLRERVVFDTSLTFRQDGTLSNFETNVYGMPSPIRIEGHILGIDFSCSARYGEIVHDFSVDARFSRQLGEALRPFTHLPNLEIGDSWQVQLVDPWTLLTASTPSFRPYLVRVVAQENKKLKDGQVLNCFHLESDLGDAWVDETGRVVMQRVDVAPLGTITLWDEPYDDAERRAIRPDMAPSAVIQRDRQNMVIGSEHDE